MTSDFHVIKIESPKTWFLESTEFHDYPGVKKSSNVQLDQKLWPKELNRFFFEEKKRLRTEYDLFLDL